MSKGSSRKVAVLADGVCSPAGISQRAQRAETVSWLPDGIFLAPNIPLLVTYLLAWPVTPSRISCLYFPICCVQGQRLAPARWEISCQKIELTTVKSTSIEREGNILHVIKT